MRSDWLERLIVFGRALWVALCQSTGRLTLWLSCHGVLLPWTSWAESKVSQQTLDRYRRRALVSKLKAQRYRIHRGPYFLRFLFDSFSAFLRFLQFPVTLFLKILFATIVCLLPFGIFFAVRVYLPVTERMARLEPIIDPKLIHSFQAVIPEVIRIKNEDVFSSRYSRKENDFAGSYSSIQTFDERSSESLLIQGHETAHKEIRRGWLLEPGKDLLLRFVPQNKNKTVRIRFRPIPVSGQSAQCKFQIMSDLGKILFATTFDTLSASRNILLKSPLTRTLQEKLMPDFATIRSSLSSQVATLLLHAGDTNLRFRMEHLDSEHTEGSCSTLLHGVEWTEEIWKKSEVNEKKSMIFLLFDSMNADVASDVKVMPWLSDFLKSPQTMNFSQHYAVDVRQNQSFKSLLVSSDAGEDHSGKYKWQMIEKLRAQGYRIIVAGSFDEEFANKVTFTPDLTIKIENETYEPRLVLSQMFNVIAQEGSTPFLLILRMKGASGPWRPTFADINFRQLFLGGGLRGLMDLLIFSHLKTLDRELSYHFNALEKVEIHKTTDLMISAERGFDLGLNLAQREQAKPTFTNDLLINQDTLRVPLGVRFADYSEEGLPNFLKSRNILTSHNDLVRTLWEGFGIRDLSFSIDSRRLWNRKNLSLENRIRSGLGFQETDFVMRLIPLRSQIQEGVLFAEPDSAGSFVKYVSQSLPMRINVPNAHGWWDDVTLNLPAGEQFRQISKRGQKEDSVIRVNSRYVREARRVIRQERRFPLRLRITAHEKQKLDLLIEEKSSGASTLLPALRDNVKVISTKSDLHTYIHHLSGQLEKDEFFDLRGSGNSFRILENNGDGAIVACPEAFIFSPTALSSALNQKTVCLLESPSFERLAQFKESGRKALSFWLVEDENQICRLQKDSGKENEDYAECLETAPHSERRG